jgi:hypothetical protein
MDRLSIPKGNEIVKATCLIYHVRYDVYVIKNAAILL